MVVRPARSRLQARCGRARTAAIAAPLIGAAIVAIELLAVEQEPQQRAGGAIAGLAPRAGSGRAVDGAFDRAIDVRAGEIATVLCDRQRPIAAHAQHVPFAGECAHAARGGIGFTSAMTAPGVDGIIVAAPLDARPANPPVDRAGGSPARPGARQPRADYRALDCAADAVRAGDGIARLHQLHRAAGGRAAICLPFAIPRADTGCWHRRVGGSGRGGGGHHDDGGHAAKNHAIGGFQTPAPCVGAGRGRRDEVDRDLDRCGGRHKINRAGSRAAELVAIGKDQLIGLVPTARAGVPDSPGLDEGRSRRNNCIIGNRHISNELRLQHTAARPGAAQRRFSGRCDGRR